MANVIAAVDAGVTALDASLGGIGGCPFAPAATGNIATEDLAYLLGRSDVTTGLSLARLIASAAWLSEALGHPIPGMLSKAGDFPPRHQLLVPDCGSKVLTRSTPPARSDRRQKWC
jgi:hydroxymethylglutaryl-CoA lyase